MNGTERDLLERFRQRGLWRANELYLAPADASELIDAVERAGMRVVGVECFEKRGDKLQPRLDLIADLSAALRPVVNIEAREFVRRLPGDVLCTLTIVS